MTFTRALSTNNYGESKFIVSATSANCTHTTIAAALAVASSGDTIFIRDGSYTENLTLVAGVNLVAYPASGLTPTVSIIGKLTATFVGTCSLSGMRLTTNSDNILSITGTNATTVNFNDCYFNVSNATGLNVNNANAKINCIDCEGDIGTTLISLFSITAISNIEFRYCFFQNTGASTTASSCAAGDVRGWWSRFQNPISITGTGFANLRSVRVETLPTNSTCVTFNTSSTASQIIEGFYSAGSATAIVITAGTVTFNAPCINSSNAATISGAGAMEYANITCGGTSAFTTTTQTADTVLIGKWLSAHQPGFLANHSVNQTDVTGNNTDVTVNFTTEIKDQGSNYDGTNTFTAPSTASWGFSFSVLMDQVTNGVDCSLKIVTSNRLYSHGIFSATAIKSTNRGTCVSISNQLSDMDAADTATCLVNISGIGANTADLSASASQGFFAGWQLG